MHGVARAAWGCALGVAALGLAAWDGGKGEEGPRSLEESATSATAAIDRAADGRSGGTRLAPPIASLATAPIARHGGHARTGTTRVYYLWYGDWSASTAPTLLVALAKSLGGSAYFRINATYADAASVVDFAGQARVGYAQGKTISDSAVFQIVASALEDGALPRDPNGAYVVLASKDVEETSGFCSFYCAWHARAALDGAALSYAFVGDPDRCPSACEPQAQSPNGDAAADAMANLVAHELSEIVTDPALDAWHDPNGLENADKCAWSFGETRTLANGARWNVELGGRAWLLQQLWSNAGTGRCALAAD